MDSSYLDSIGRKCEKELDKIGVHCGVVDQYRARDDINEWGMCIYVGDKKYHIIINSILLNRKYLKGLKTVVYHELLHTLPDCIHHTVKWKENANVVKTRLGYPVHKNNTYNELGIPLDEYLKTLNYKYIIQCGSCGNIYGYKKKNDVVRGVYHYCCGVCGGKLKIIR